jgi:hypothetical protein
MFLPPARISAPGQLSIARKWDIFMGPGGRRNPAKITMNEARGGGHKAGVDEIIFWAAGTRPAWTKYSVKADGKPGLKNI